MASDAVHSYFWNRLNRRNDRDEFLMATPLYFAQGSFGILNRGLHLVAGIFSVFLGITIVYEKLFARS